MGGRKHVDESITTFQRLLHVGATGFLLGVGHCSAGLGISERLWKLAVNLADAHGLNRTASALRLNYDSLKKRVESANAHARSATSAFVELPPSPLASSGECVVEFEDATGARLCMHLKGCDAPDLVALGRGFWQRGK